MRKDIAVATVLRVRSKRYRFVDLTRFFCGPRLCYPVIGGTLVSRDTYGHLTREYARSLEPCPAGQGARGARGLTRASRRHSSLRRRPLRHMIKVGAKP